MKAKELEKYLSELGDELKSQGVHNPIRVLMVGGAYVILFIKMKNRATNDIDVIFLDEGQPHYQSLLNVVQSMARKHQRILNNKWLNTDATGILTTLGPIPPGEIWQCYGPLEIYIPSTEYILTLKLISTRQKDLDDAKYLCRYLQITRKEQARSIVYNYIDTPGELHEICDLEENLNYIDLI